MNDNEIILYSDENGKTNVSVRFSEEDVWVTQKQLAQVYETTQENVSMHISNIYSDGELPREATNKKFLLVQNEGKRQVKREIDHYNSRKRIRLVPPARTCKYEKRLRPFFTGI